MLSLSALPFVPPARLEPHAERITDVVAIDVQVLPASAMKNDDLSYFIFRLLIGSPINVGRPHRARCHLILCLAS